MTIADDLLPLIHGIRAIPGEFGLHPYSVQAVRRYQSDVDDYAETTLDIVHANNQPVHVRFATAKERFAQGLAENTLRVGPITPEHAGGGYSFEQLNPTLEAGEEFYYRITGPAFPDGAVFALAEIDTGKALGWMLTLEQSETGLAVR